MNIDKKIRDYLQIYNKKTILLEDLEKTCDGQVSYEQFSNIILELINEEVLTKFKNGKIHHQNPRLHYKYKFHKPKLNKELSYQIHTLQKKYMRLNLSTYYHLTMKDWEKDLPYIKQINEYITENAHLPKDEVLHTELSFQLVGNEKWIENGHGREVLERLGLWDNIKIQKHPDPLMMAINTNNLNKKIYFHLIVENKSNYYALLGDLSNSDFTTLIYGQGWKITSNIKQLEKQLPSLKGIHKIFYFGDLDYEGISIWHNLSQVRKIDLALDFYKELIKQKESETSKNQKRNKKAMEVFLNNFNNEKEIIDQLLKDGKYYPQEAILEEKQREILRNYRMEEG